MASSTKISIGFALTAAALFFVGGSFFTYQLSLFLIYAIVAQGVGFVWSKTGILPLGQSLFFGLGAYGCAAILRDIHTPFAQLMALVVLIAVISLFGYLIAALVFKGRSDTGPYFSLITLALAMIAEQIANSATSITGGFNGLSGYDSFLSLDPFGNMYWVIVAFATLVLFLLLRIGERPLGLIMSAIVDNEPRLQLLGFNTSTIKSLSFAISAAVAALAGVLFANYQGIVTPSAIGFFLAADFVIWTAVGGRTHPLGAIIGVVIIGSLSANLRDSIEFWDVLLALGFLFVVLKSPEGLWGLINNWLPRAHKKGQQIYIDPPRTHHDKTKAQLIVNDITLRIGQVTILDGVKFSTSESGIVAIIGPNGAGKTSVLNVLTSNLSSNSGSITYESRTVNNQSPHLALREGIGRKLQVPSVFMSMSVADNIMIAHFASRLHFGDYLKTSAVFWQSDWYKELAAMPCYAFLKNSEQLAGNLSQGHRQFLEFLMTTLSEPRLLLLDEPAAGLAPQETSIMAQLIKKYQKFFGALVLVIEHDMHIVEAISDCVVVLHQGKTLASGKYKDIQDNEQVAAVYLGESKA